MREGLLAEAEVRAFAAGLPQGVLRAKGLVHLREHPERAAVLQVLGTRWSLQPGPLWGVRRPQTQVVVIGLPGTLDDQFLNALLPDED